MMPSRPLLIGLALATAATCVQAGLFDDTEARKAIVELRGRVEVSEAQAQARLVELSVLNAQLTEQISAMRRSLLELNNQLEGLRTEVARLRGGDERLVHDLAELQKRQLDVSQSLDERLRRLEPLRITIEGREALVAPDEKRAYDEALELIRGGQFDRAVPLLNQFLRRFGGGPYGDLARFWLGNALYGKRDYPQAIVAYRGFVAMAPEHPRAAEALLALANSQAEMKDPRAARRTIEELMKAYPESEAANAGKERLAALR